MSNNVGPGFGWVNSPLWTEESRNYMGSLNLEFTFLPSLYLLRGARKILF